MTDNYEITKAIEEVKATLVSMENDGRNYASEYLSKETLVICMNALDIINRQQVEIERLKKILAEEEEKYKLCAKRFYKVGVKEFVERLKALYTSNKTYDRKNPHTSLEYLFYNIDKIKKEMAGYNDV